VIGNLTSRIDHNFLAVLAGERHRTRVLALLFNGYASISCRISGGAFATRAGYRENGEADSGGNIFAHRPIGPKAGRLLGGPTVLSFRRYYLPKRELADIQELKSLTGQEVAVGDWLEITQERINQFADATGDHQWIHVDPERCKRESPFGATIAHGYLTLSLIPYLSQKSFAIRQPFRMGINYGSNRVRFANPVPAGSRIRNPMTVLEVSH